jgi:hypothetical protein
VNADDLRVSDIVAADRVQWSRLDTPTIRKVLQEAAAAGDEELVKRAERALARRDTKR